MTRKKKKSLVSPGSAFESSLTRMQALLSSVDFAALLSELQQPLYSSIRINPLKANLNSFHEWVERYGWQVEPIPFCPLGFRILNSHAPVSQTAEHRMGYYYMQDASSMLPAELFDLNVPKPLILDLAASPGGKTTHLASRTMDHGLIIANDSSKSRLQALRIVLQNWGAANIAITGFPGELFGKWFPEIFDIVLLDAPCSMEGLRSTDSHPLRAISGSERSSLVRRQVALLESAILSCRVGGQIVYSTCTLAPEEDEEVLQVILDKYPGTIRLEDLSNSLRTQVPALSSYNSRDLHPEVARAARLWPHLYHTAGFFAAKLIKLSHPTQIFPQLESNISHFRINPFSAKQEESFASLIKTAYGFDIYTWLGDQELVLHQHDRLIFALPQQFLEEFPGLIFYSLGMLIAEETPHGILISHELASRFGNRFKSGKVVLDDLQSKSWLRGEDQRVTLSNQLSPYVILTSQNGTVLGRGKYASGKIKNLLPHKYI